MLFRGLPLFSAEVLFRIECHLLFHGPLLKGIFRHLERVTLRVEHSGFELVQGTEDAFPGGKAELLRRGRSFRESFSFGSLSPSSRP